MPGGAVRLTLAISYRALAHGRTVHVSSPTQGRNLVSGQPQASAFQSRPCPPPTNPHPTWPALPHLGNKPCLTNQGEQEWFPTDLVPPQTCRNVKQIAPGTVAMPRDCQSRCGEKGREL